MSKIKIGSEYYEVEGILFDKDGTLLDFASLWIDWIMGWIDQALANNPGYDVSRAQLAQIIGVDVNHNSWDPDGPLATGGNEDLKTLLSSCFYKAGMPWNESISLIINSRESNESFQDWKEYLQPVKGLKAFLQQLHQATIPIGVITSDDTQSAIEHLKALKIGDYFTSIVGQDAVARAKPFNDSVLKACGEMDINPGKTLIFGDSNGDMVTGKNANMLAAIGIAPEQIETTSYLKQADQIIRNYENISLIN